MLATFIAASEVVFRSAPVHGAPYPGIQEWGRGVPQEEPPGDRICVNDTLTLRIPGAA